MISRLITILIAMGLGVVIASAQLQTHTHQMIYDSGEKAYTISPDASAEYSVDFKQTGTPVRRILRVVGGIEMPGKFAPRGEEFFRQQEFLIDDNLDSVNVLNDRYSLHFKGENYPFEQHAYQRITGADFSKGEIDLTVNYKCKNLKVSKGADFGIELQLYYKKSWRHADEVYDKADSVVFVALPQGSGNFKTLKQSVKLSPNVAAILVRVGGTGYSGECWLEAPRFSINGKTVFNSPFVKNTQRRDNYNYWVGVNMTTRSWPMWRLEWNGRKVFEGRIFDRASDIADFYIPLPADVTGSGKFKLTLLSEPHRTSFSYALRRIAVIEESADDFEIVSAPRYLAVGDTSAILIEVNRPGITLNLSSSDNSLIVVDKSKAATKSGLYTMRISALKPGTNVKFTVSSVGKSKSFDITQLVERERDGAYLSSGDEIYIDKEYQPYNQFFKWYIRERIGNFYHFRPSYQWSGVRITDDGVMKNYTSMLNDLNMHYAWQVEGRTLAATRINASIESLVSPMFRGMQAHENDGGYYYWQHFLYNGLHSDMAARTRPYGGIFAKHRPIYTDHGIFIHYDPYAVKDMADGASRFVANLSYSRGPSTRHTGPSTMFRYLYQAGYEWLGAEQMYGPEDVIMSSLRGASRAYGKADFGSLHAVQWGSSPFTDPKHSLRFFNSLAVAYIHGSSHINTEEGLWTDEYSNDRFTESGRQHLYAQHQMLDFIETHSRKGELNTKIAVIQGRNDAWKSFGRTSVWSQKGKKWEFNEAMESFDLLKVFYPENELDYCSTTGLFTATPFGPVDILPVEAPQDVLNSYKTLIFLGWNSFDNADFIRIRKFVEKGGTLLLSAAHLNSSVQPDEAPRFPQDDTVIRCLLGNDYQNYKKRIELSLGKGRVIYYPENIYPASEIIRESYKDDMISLAKEVTSAEYGRGWVKSSEKIDFTVWDSKDMRTIYLLNIDWESNMKSRNAVVTVGNHVFNIDVERYRITAVRINAGVAATASENTSDILEISRENGIVKVRCQTAKPDRITIYDGQTGRSLAKDVERAGIFTLEFKP